MAEEVTHAPHNPQGDLASCPCARLSDGRSTAAAQGYLSTKQTISGIPFALGQFLPSRRALTTDSLYNIEAEVVMKIRSFRIANFKGIKQCKLDIETSAKSIVTLIGLNESGKTTILEAFANFLGEDQDLIDVGTRKARSSIKDFIPKHRRANFTGVIELAATVELESSDKRSLEEFFKNSHQMKLNSAILPSSFVINRTHKFKDSEPISSTNYWDIGFKVRKLGETKQTLVQARDETSEIWQSAIRHLTARLPRICYFPTFLFEIPPKIYLEEGAAQTGVSKYYYKILQDVLDAQRDGLKITTHVIERIAKFRKKNADGTSVSMAEIDQDVRENIDHLFRKMSTELNRVIFGAWNDIFTRHPKNKKIEVKWGLDQAAGNLAYCEFFIIDGEEKYAISERSLGFRWFFLFLLFAQFGVFRGEGKKTIFLFDEPASNLHSSAQLKLLASFPRICGEDNSVVYSTHSHYMIEPAWLEQAYVVINRAVDYDDVGEEDMDHFTVRPTDVTAQKYRDFVGQHPKQTAYFQPVLDRLDYNVSPLIGSKNCLIMEGKQDFYAAKYFLPQLGCVAIDILPGAGAGNMGVLVSLFVGWGREFLILLDDDKEGRVQKQRYQDEFLLSDQQVATFGDVDPVLKGRELENLFTDELAKLVQLKRGLSTKPKKRDFALFFQERLATSTNLGLEDIDEGTKATMKLVASFARKRLS